MKMKHAVAGLALGVAVASQASIKINVAESGSDVVVSSAGGSLDLTGFTVVSHESWGESNDILLGLIGSYFGVNDANDGSVNTLDDQYTHNGTFNVSKSGGWTDSSSTTLIPSTIPAYTVGFSTSGSVYVPTFYVSGSGLGAFSYTVPNASFASLGLTANESATATWAADSITIQTIPEPATFAYLGIFAFGALAVRRIFLI